MCWDADIGQARRTAREIWPTAGLDGELTQELKLPAHFEQATKTVREEDVVRKVVCGPDPEAFVSRIQEYEKAGFDHVYLHQVGPNQEGFFRFLPARVAAETGPPAGTRPRVKSWHRTTKTDARLDELVLAQSSAADAAWQQAGGDFPQSNAAFSAGDLLRSSRHARMLRATCWSGSGPHGLTPARQRMGRRAAVDPHHHLAVN